MDDFMLVRFALDNVRVPEIAATAQEALDRIIRGRPTVDPDGPDGRAYERAQRRARDRTRQPQRSRHLDEVEPPRFPRSPTGIEEESPERNATDRRSRPRAQPPRAH